MDFMFISRQLFSSGFCIFSRLMSLSVCMDITPEISRILRLVAFSKKCY